RGRGSCAVGGGEGQWGGSVRVIGSGVGRPRIPPARANPPRARLCCSYISVFSVPASTGLRRASARPVASSTWCRNASSPSGRPVRWAPRIANEHVLAQAACEEGVPLRPAFPRMPLRRRKPGPEFRNRNSRIPGTPYSIDVGLGLFARWRAPHDMLCQERANAREFLAPLAQAILRYLQVHAPPLEIRASGTEVDAIGG